MQTPKEVIMEANKKRITMPRAVVVAGCLAAIAGPASASAMPVGPDAWQATHSSAPAPYVSDAYAGGLTQVKPSDTSGARLDHRGLQTPKPAAQPSPAGRSYVKATSALTAAQLAAAYGTGSAHRAQPVTGSTTSVTREVRTISGDDNSTLAIVLASSALGLALCGAGYATVRLTRIQRRIAQSGS
jgi:hypothetical protein